MAMKMLAKVLGLEERGGRDLGRRGVDSRGTVIWWEDVEASFENVISLRSRNINI